MSHWRKLKLGEWILATCKLVRTKERVGGGISNRTWRLEEFNPPQKVMVIGKRTLSDGRASWDSESGWEYNPTAFMFALLVVSSMKEKPFLIPYREVPVGNDITKFYYERHEIPPGLSNA